MNGVVSFRKHVEDDFVPTAKLNGSSPDIGLIEVDPDCYVIVYGPEEARRYARAFTEMADLMEAAQMAAAAVEAVRQP